LSLTFVEIKKFFTKILLIFKSSIFILKFIDLYKKKNG
jgi:hypothetical protein